MADQITYLKGDTFQTDISMELLPIDEAKTTFSVHIGELDAPPTFSIEQSENSRFEIPVAAMNALDPTKPHYMDYKIKLSDGRVFVKRVILVIQELDL